MDETGTFQAIETTTFDSLLKEYPGVVPEKLSKLDQERYNTIPGLLRQRTGAAWLTKDEVATLVDWKLSHGKFRPTLKGLVQQNTDTIVRDQTRDGFKAFAGKSSKHAKEALNILTKLRGIGPATASLLLSVFDPDTAPFFSDELFRWCFFEDGKGHGWDRDIKYNVKEYLELFDKVQQSRERFIKQSKREVAAVEMEKVAYVLGKLAAAGVSTASAAGTKRKAEVAPDKDLHDDSVATARDESSLTIASNAVNEQEPEQKEQVKAKKAKLDTTSETKKPRERVKPIAETTTAASRSRRKATISS